MRREQTEPTGILEHQNEPTSRHEENKSGLRGDNKKTGRPSLVPLRLSQ